MMKQDNREKAQTFDEKMSVLKKLLTEEETSSDLKEELPSEKKQKKDKNIYITIQGDRNIISMGKDNRIVSKKNKKKIYFISFLSFFVFF